MYCDSDIDAVVEHGVVGDAGVGRGGRGLGARRLWTRRGLSWDGNFDQATFLNLTHFSART